MLSNINNSTNPNFGATLRITSPIKNSARLETIKQAFSEQTASMKDTLSMSRLGRDWNNAEAYFLGTNKDNTTCGFLRKSLDTMLDTMSDSDVVTKLVKTLKALKELRKREANMCGFEDTRYKAQHEQRRNNLIAQSFREKGNEVMASRFEYLANCFGKKLEKLQDEERKINNSFFAKLNEIADGDKDILDLKHCM